MSILLNPDKFVQIGSRALNVQTKKSDTDICIMQEDIPDRYLWGKQPVTKTALEMYGISLLIVHSKLYKIGTLDLFVFTDKEKLDIVAKVMAKMVAYPKFLLKWKWFRVKLFRLLLRTNGFLS